MALRRTDRYTIPFPLPIEPDRIAYDALFAEAPTSARIFLRVVAFLTGRRPAEVLRARHLAALREKVLATGAKYAVGTPTVLTEQFVKLYRELIHAGVVLDESIQRVLGPGKFGFRRHLRSERAPATFAAIEEATHVSADMLRNLHLTAASATATIQEQLSRQLGAQRAAVEEAVDAFWVAIRAADLVSKLNPREFEPSPVEIVAVRTPLVHLYQVCDLLIRTATVQALVLPAAYVGTPAVAAEHAAAGLLRVASQMLNEVPLLDMIRLAYGHPNLEVPHVSLRSNWWQSFTQQIFERTVLAVPTQLFDARLGSLEQYMRVQYDEGITSRRPIPVELYRNAVLVVLSLVGNTRFADQRRAITQLVIDGRFFRMDVRSQLHQSLLELDQAAERLQTLFDEEAPAGSYFEEAERLKRHAGTRAVADRQNSAVMSRYRGRVRAQIESFVEAIDTIGRIIAANSGKPRDFELSTTSRKATTIAQHLPSIGEVWPQLAVLLTALAKLEAEVAGLPIPSPEDLEHTEGSHEG